MAKYAYSLGSVAQGRSKCYANTKYGRNHYGVCCEGSTSCFKCGQTEHFMRECLENQPGSGNMGNRAQSSSISPPGRASPRGDTSGTGGGANRLYAFNNRQDH